VAVVVGANCCTVAFAPRVAWVGSLTCVVPPRMALVVGTGTGGFMFVATGCGGPDTVMTGAGCCIITGSTAVMTGAAMEVVMTGAAVVVITGAGAADMTDAAAGTDMTDAAAGAAADMTDAAAGAVI